MNNDDDTNGFVFDTNDQQPIQDNDDDVERFWDRMYRICTKELINQGLGFSTHRAKVQLQ
jgi:hypothetical protein